MIRTCCSASSQSATARSSRTTAMASGLAAKTDNGAVWRRSREQFCAPLGDPASPRLAGLVRMIDELPMCCRTCVDRQSRYVFPSWTHTCLRQRQMVEGCRWKRVRTITIKEEK